jgi:hypothetical protein
MIRQKQQFVFFIIFVSFIFISCKEDSTQKQRVSEQKENKMEKSEKKQKLLRHLVLFKFKEKSNKDDVNRLNNAFNALPNAISIIKDFEWGINDSPENLHQGFTHCYMVTFDSEEDRDSIYTPHAYHQAFVADLKPHLEKVFVVDYWTNP